MNRLLKLLVCLATLWPAATAQAQTPTKDDVLRRDFTEMLQWFEGEYDNMEQVYFDELMEVGPDEQHERIHSIFKRADLPGVGADTFYVQQYSDNDPAKVYRQRIYSFMPDYERRAIALRILSFKDAAAALDAHIDPTKLDGLGPDDLTAMPEGCTVYWRRQANQFIGLMDQGACRIMSQRSGKELIIEDDLVLTEREIWIQDRATDVDGNYVFGNKAGVPHKLHKQSLFTCWMSVQNDQARGGWDFKPGLKISDQGGEILVTTSGDNPQTVGLRMRNVVWPYGRNRASLVLYAHKDMGARATSYAWTEPDGQRIALNLRWLQASCTKDE